MSLALAPDEVRPDLDGLSRRLIEHCEAAGDRFAILSAPDVHPADARFPVDESSFGAVYTPWVEVQNATTSGTLWVPPSGHVAGVFARTEVEFGVHRAPAGPLAKLRGVVSTRSISDALQHTLWERRVNPLRRFPGTGVAVWGNRTGASNRDERYINVRRQVISLAEAIQEGTEWALLEPNTKGVRLAVEDAIRLFLETQWQAGAFAGSTASESYFVRCHPDGERVDCVIGVAPLIPVEIIVLA